jgi:hypothetical protein
MRRFLIEVIVVSAAFAILWIFAGRQISEVVDRFETVKIESTSVELIAYQGSGDGGTLIIAAHQLSLAPLNPHVGSTKDNQLALANAGKVFAFGPLRSSNTEVLAAEIPKPDTAVLLASRGYLPWPNFDGSLKPHLKRSSYYQFISKKSDGAKLEMVWSTEGEKETLIRIQIANASR